MEKATVLTGRSEIRFYGFLVALSGEALRRKFKGLKDPRVGLAIATVDDGPELEGHKVRTIAAICKPKGKGWEPLNMQPIVTSAEPDEVWAALDGPSLRGTAARSGLVRIDCKATIDVDGHSFTLTDVSAISIVGG